MSIQKNVSLKTYNTFGIDAKAREYLNIETVDHLKTALVQNSSKSIFILGGGSNMLLTKDIEALVLHINLKGIYVKEETENHVIVEAQAGENWHDFVLWCLERNYGGIENLSLIPGNIGAVPMQNIGAYGVEIKDVFQTCEAISIKTQELKTFTKQECSFSYRESVFKQDLKGKYIITSVCLKLSKQNHQLHIDYGALTSELKALRIKKPTIQDVSKAVIALRKSKLPNPKEIGNSGSFFKNPVLEKSEFLELQQSFPDVPHYVVSESKIKVPAGWLIEVAGFKGKRFNGCGVHDKQALVLVNYGNASGEDIYKLSQLIQKTILRLFNITIETEVNII
jgi:UDP-N-acetylmuramate dehydrogenase